MSHVLVGCFNVYCVRVNTV